jgi:phage shock protein PspC (stress-responsive transcriptional regulator)
VVAGVLAGLANRFGISPWTARALFLLSLLLPGPQVLAYLVLWGPDARRAVISARTRGSPGR